MCTSCYDGLHIILCSCLLQHWPEGEAIAAVLNHLGRFGLKDLLEQFYDSYQQHVCESLGVKPHVLVQHQMIAWRGLDTSLLHVSIPSAMQYAQLTSA